MNKLYTIGALLFFSLNSIQISAQELVKEGNQWNVYFPPTFDPNSSTSLYTISGDTLINDISYHKMAIKNRVTEELTFIDTYLREDSTKKVFVKRYDNADFLLYDFGLELDDVFTTDYCSLKVIAIDSVQLSNGQMRKRYEFEGIDAAYQTTFWVEGIGSIHSVIDHVTNFCFFDAPATLLCFYEDGELLYPESPPACIINDVSEITVQYELEVFPNPFYDKIFVEDPKHAFSEIQVYNSLGQLLYTEEMNSSFMEMNLAHLEVGIYYLIVRNDKGVIYTHRIVHQ